MKTQCSLNSALGFWPPRSLVPTASMARSIHVPIYFLKFSDASG